jgi:hypothetical protein
MSDHGTHVPDLARRMPSKSLIVQATSSWGRNFKGMAVQTWYVNRVSGLVNNWMERI